MKIILFHDSMINNQGNLSNALNNCNNTIYQIDNEINSRLTKIMSTSTAEDRQNAMYGESGLKRRAFDYLGTKIIKDGKIGTKILSKINERLHKFTYD